MMEDSHALARSHFRPQAARRVCRRLRHRAPRHRPHPRPLARPAGDRGDRRSRRRHADRAASSVPPLGRPYAEGVPAGADARTAPASCCATSASVLDASYEVGLSGPGRLHDLFVTHEAMSPGEWKSGARGPDRLLRLPPFAVRHRAGDGDRARPVRPGLRRLRRGESGARRHAQPLAEGEATSRTAPAPRRSPHASSTRSCGGRTSRCAWC